MRGRFVRRRTLYQSTSVPAPQPDARATTGWAGFFDGRLPRRVIAATLTSFAVAIPLQVPTQFFAADQSAEIPDIVLPSHRVEAALQQFDTRPLLPLFPYSDQSTEIPDAVLPSRRVEAALLPFTAGQPQGDVYSITPQGYEARYPDRFKRPFPVSAQAFAPWSAQGDLVSTPQGWPSTFPDRFAKKFPAADQLDAFFTGYQVPTQFVGNAWVVGWEPPWARFPAKVQQFVAEHRYTKDAAPEGWGATYPERFAKPVPASVQRFDQFPQYQVATEATPQGWTPVYPDRFGRKVPAAVQQFDLPVLAVYTATVTTFPEGWRVVFSEPRRVTLFDVDAFALGSPAAAAPSGWSIHADLPLRKPAKDTGAIVHVTVPAVPQGWWSVVEPAIRRPVNDRGAFTSGTPASAATLGWTVAEPALRRPAKAQGADFVAYPAQRAVWGWATAFEAKIARPRLLPPPEGFIPAPTAAFAHGWAVKVPDLFVRRRARPTAPATGIERTPPSIDLPDGWWVNFSVAFKHPVAIPWEFFRWGRYEVVIIREPPLVGDSEAPSLKGREAEATLLGMDAEASLRGRDAQPEEDATLSDPTLKGKV